MSLPPYLADLPSLSDVISQIEARTMAHDNPFSERWMRQPVFSDENTDNWTQKQTFRYEQFMRTGRGYTYGGERFLPTPEPRDKDIPPGAEDEGRPFSPLAMVAAWDLCGYKPTPITVDSIRLLCELVEMATKIDLQSTFVAPDGLLMHILCYSIHHQDKDEPVSKQCHGGAKAANALRDAIIAKVQALATWPGVIELLDQVDWDDESVLINLASDPGYADTNSSNPLCDTMHQVDRAEVVSAIRLRILFQEWALQQIPPTAERPAFYKNALPGNRNQVSDRVMHAKSLIGMTRFERAIVRVCRPTLHPQVPPQISLLNFEMLLREKPSRVGRLTEPLFKAIGASKPVRADVGYHYTVVHIHYMLRKLIFDKASTAPGWRGRTVEMMSGKPRIGTSDYSLLRGEVIDTAYNRLIQINLAAERDKATFRELRLHRMSYYFPPINWANYLTIDLDSVPRTIALDGIKLRTTLNMACWEAFGTLLPELMDARYEHGGELFGTSSVQAGYRALVVGLHDPGMRHIEHCLYKPDLRPHPRGAPAERTIMPGCEGSVPLAQSSHSYLRDNPPLLRPTERIVAAEDPTPLPVEVEVEENAPVFRVNSAQMKVVERLLGNREGVVRWAQLINLFRRIGYRAEGMGGSAFHITPVIPGGQSILLYRPHAGPSFSPEQTAAVGAQIASTFGWSVDNFVRQGEANGDSQPHAD